MHAKVYEADAFALPRRVFSLRNAFLLAEASSAVAETLLRKLAVRSVEDVDD